ncbi:MAG TPA: ATP-binding protein, partial [Candidatus Acidoferrales bacterium]|nr:ATP-binding protein [Candidatus Acidoferrales bacterium]
TGLYATTGVFLHRPGFPFLGPLCLVLECFFAATWIHLALVFPIERRFEGSRRWLPLFPYLVSAAQAWRVLHGYYAQPPDVGPLHISYLFNSIAIICFVTSLVVGFLFSRDLLPRLRVKAILTGAIISLPWPILAFIDNAWSGRRIPIQLALVLTPFGYASLGYAIVKHDLFDIDRIVRRSFVYTLLSSIVIAAYALLLEMPERFLPGFGSEHRTLLGMAFVLVLAFALEPLRNVVQNLVDRAFYRGRLDYRATIRSLSAAMASLLDLDEVVARVTQVVTAALQIESTAVCLVDAAEGGRVFVRLAGAEKLIEHDDEPAVVELARLAQDNPGEFDVHALARNATPDHSGSVVAFLERMGARVIVPLILRGRAIGFLLFGAKLSGQTFDADAIDLLRTLADQTAIAVQNAQSLQALEQLNRDLDAQVRTRTAQLSGAYEELKSAQAQLVQAEKMASLGQLVAGVAHELNNPASFVYGGLENIREGLADLIDVLRAYENAPISDATMRAAIEQKRRQVRIETRLEDLPELLRVSGEGLERIKKIVDDLRVFARADSGERLPVDVSAAIDSTLRLLAHRIAGAGIVVSTDFEPAPKIKANAGQLNQVWMNLLTNALDALEGRPEPQIGVKVRNASDSGIDGVEVSIRDNGCGIAPEHLERLFDPFFTTKPIGQGTGLGLSIAYGAVKAHGGTIDVESRPGSGTTVRVRLPVATQ